MDGGVYGGHETSSEVADGSVSLTMCCWVFPIFWEFFHQLPKLLQSLFFCCVQCIQIESINFDYLLPSSEYNTHLNELCDVPGELRQLEFQ